MFPESHVTSTTLRRSSTRHTKLRLQLRHRSRSILSNMVEGMKWISFWNKLGPIKFDPIHDEQNQVLHSPHISFQGTLIIASISASPMLAPTIATPSLKLLRDTFWVRSDMGVKDKGIPQDTRQLSSPSRAKLPVKTRTQMTYVKNLWAIRSYRQRKVRFEFPHGVQGELTSKHILTHCLAVKTMNSGKSENPGKTSFLDLRVFADIWRFFADFWRFFAGSFSCFFC